MHLIPVFTSATVGSNPRSYLFIFATVLIDVDTAPKCLTEPIRYVMNHFRDRCGSASLRYSNRTEITVVRERQQRRRRRQRERQKSNRFVKQNNNFVRESRFSTSFKRFYVIFFLIDIFGITISYSAFQIYCQYFAKCKREQSLIQEYLTLFYSEVTML